MPSLDSITFSTTGLDPKGDTNGVRTWQTPNGYGLGLYYFALSPDIFADVNSLSSLSSFYGNHVATVNAVGILIDLKEIDQCKAIKMIIRIPQQPSGVTYLGSITLPFRDFSFVIKMQCPEHGPSGIRESVILNELLGSGEVRLDKTGKIEGWEIPLGFSASPVWRINKAEAAKYDRRFPHHPLSILRRTFDQIESSARITGDVKAAPKFSYPK